MYDDEDSTTVAYTQLTFHFTNGQSESFIIGGLIYGDGQDVRREVRRFLQDDWWIIKLAGETVFINAKNVLKVELKPPIPSIEGEGVIDNAARVTPLTKPR